MKDPNVQKEWDDFPVGFLRQHINEDLLPSDRRLVSDDEIRDFLKIGPIDKWLQDKITSHNNSLVSLLEGMKARHTEKTELFDHISHNQGIIKAQELIKNSLT